MRNTKTTPTAENFLINKLNETQPNSNTPPTPKQVEEWMIDFAKMHVTEALNQASEKAKADMNFNFMGNVPYVIKDSILKAYSLYDIE